MNNTTRIVPALSLVLVGGLALSGCAGGNPGDSAAMTSVTVRSSGAPSGFDPAKGASVYDGIVQMAVYDTLVAHADGQREEDGGQPHPLAGGQPQQV